MSWWPTPMTNRRRHPCHPLRLNRISGRHSVPRPSPGLQSGLAESLSLARSHPCTLHPWTKTSPGPTSTPSPWASMPTVPSRPRPTLSKRPAASGSPHSASAKSSAANRTSCSRSCRRPASRLRWCCWWGSAHATSSTPAWPFARPRRRPGNWPASRAHAWRLPWEIIGRPTRSKAVWPARSSAARDRICSGPKKIDIRSRHSCGPAPIRPPSPRDKSWAKASTLPASWSTSRPRTCIPSRSPRPPAAWPASAG